jgi:uncharacterized ferritin-like protein (DUF455 family)
MNAPFLAELDSFRNERLRPVVDPGRSPMENARADAKTLLAIALANEVSVSELAAMWVPATPELDAKLAFAKVSGDEAAHFEIVRDRLLALGFDMASFKAPGPNPLGAYLVSLTTTVERVAAGLYALEAMAYGVNENFIAFCESKGDMETVCLYRDHIQPDERSHHELGRTLLAKYCTDAASQARAREVVGRTLELAAEVRGAAAQSLGVAQFPGC